jgi:hypothetical protein
MVGDSDCVVSDITLLSSAHFHRRLSHSALTPAVSNYSVCFSILLTSSLSFSSSFSSEVTWRS